MIGKLIEEYILATQTTDLSEDHEITLLAIESRLEEVIRGIVTDEVSKALARSRETPLHEQR